MIKNSYTVAIQVIMTIVIGLALVIQPAVSFINHQIGGGRPLTLNPYIFNSTLALTIIGILLLYLAFYLYTRRRTAYIAVFTLCALALLIMLFMRHKPVIMITVQAIFIIWLFVSRRLYTVRSDLVSIAFGVRISLLIGLVGYIYALVGFMLLGPSGFHHTFSLSEAAGSSFQTLFTFNDLDTPTRQAELFVSSLNIISGVLLVLIIGSLFKPVRFALSTNRGDKKRVREILQQTSTSSEDYFKLWPDDKHYYFSETSQSFLAYKTSGQTAIVLGDPSGDTREFAKLISSFHEFVSSNGWSIAAINTTSTSEKMYQSEGLKNIFIGNEAIITIADYISHTSRSKHFRYVNNRAERDGLAVEYWQTPTDENIRTLRHISDSWLSRGGRKEYTFFMGYFDHSYLRASSIMVLKEAETVVAYINVVPSFTELEASIDHLRALPNISPAAMHFLLAQLIDLLAEQGKITLNIGFAPLAGGGVRDGKHPVTERLIKIIKKFGNRYYSFQGVEQFKGKFQPVWHPRYLYYSGNAAVLAGIVRDVERASRLYTRRSSRQKVILGIIVVLIIAAITQFI